MSHHTTQADRADANPEFPFLVEGETELHDDSVAGTHGTRVTIVEEDCPACGYDRAKAAHLVLPDVYSVTCNACGHTIHQG